MTKWICKKCKDCEPCSLDIGEAIKDPFICPLGCKIPEWNKIKEEPVTTCNQLPKLTTEVFARPDCPEWAKYAAMAPDGVIAYYIDYPLSDDLPALNYSIIKDSLIERPAKLPEWCKVGEWVYSTVYNEYTQISDLDEFEIELKDGAYCSVGRQTFFEDYRPARLRPYNAKEMKALVGKVIEVEPGQFSLCLRVTGYWADFLDDCAEDDDRARIISYNNDMLKRTKTIDGKPCGVFEHLDNGVWKE